MLIRSKKAKGKQKAEVKKPKEELVFTLKGLYINNPG
jgi:hypothetical protein